MQSSKHILIIAGETSGDTHGAGLVAGLREQDPGLKISGIGGANMESRGMELLYHVKEISFMGFAEIIRHLPFLKRVRDNLLDWMEQHQPDAVILIDYPGFNLRFARKIRSTDVPVYYYISPQVWAWGKGRLRGMGEYLRKMFVIFPFEEQLYREHGIPAEFVGHPLVEEIEDQPSKREFFSSVDLNPELPLIGLFPGSRTQELHRHTDVMLKAWERITGDEERELQACIALAPDLEYEDSTLAKDHPGIQPVRGKTHAVMQHCDIAIVSSGTATLELAYFTTPMVIIYRMNMLSYWIGKLLVDMPYIGLANIVAQQQIVPELIQRDANPDRIAHEVTRFLQDDEYFHEVKDALGTVKDRLGDPGAGRRVAESIYTEVYGD